MVVELATEATVIGFCDLGVVEVLVYAFGEIIADTAEPVGLTLVICVEEAVDPAELLLTPTAILLNEEAAEAGELIGLALMMGFDEVLKLLEVLLTLTAILLTEEVADMEELIELTLNIGIEVAIELAEILLTPMAMLLTKELRLVAEDMTLVVTVVPRALSMMVVTVDEEPPVDEKTEMEDLLVEEMVHGTVVVLVIKSVTTAWLYAEMLEKLPVGCEREVIGVPVLFQPAMLPQAEVLDCTTAMVARPLKAAS